MTTRSFNAGWRIRPKTSIFAQLMSPVASGEPVTLPHDALIGLERRSNAAGAQAYYPGGTFEYLKDFDAPEEWRHKRITLEFQGVYRDAVVFVNDGAAAHRPYGYSTFEVELDPYLRYGQANTIRVEARAHDDSRWYTGAGIYRDVLLTVDELVHPGEVRVTTPDVDDERAVVEVAVEVWNRSLATCTADVAVAMVDADGCVVAQGSSPATVRAGDSAVVRLRTYVQGARRWNLDDPHLYTAVVGLVAPGQPSQEKRIPFGIRSLQLDPQRGLRINGTTVKLRGACVHHDNGILGAAAFAAAEDRKVRALKEAGFNAIRSSHNPLSPAILDACDRLGMLVMDEAFDVWTESKSSHDYSLSFQEWWERDLEAMVAKDFNHPSVILYSLGNEIPETGNPFGAEWGRRLAEKVRSLDATRFITNGVNPLVSTIEEVGRIAQAARADSPGEADGGVNDLMSKQQDMQQRITASEMVTTRTAEAFASLDVAGLNYGDARYALDRELFPNRVIVGSETFTPLIARNWATILDSPHVIGDFAWTGLDYLGEVGIGRVQYAEDGYSFEAPFPWIAAWCGDLDLTCHRRPSSYYREIVFGLRTEPFIAVQRPEHAHREAVLGAWSWSDSISSWTWAVELGSPVRVEVYADADEIELLLNGAALGRERVGSTQAMTAYFDTNYSPGKLTAVAYRGGEETGRTSLVTAEGRTRLSAVLDRTTVVADTGDLAFIPIELRDDAGTLVTCEERQVSVRIEGAGVLQALGSARPDNAERYDAGSHTTFDGRALAVVRPTAAGVITLTITAEGLDAVEVALTAVQPGTLPGQ